METLGKECTWFKFALKETDPSEGTFKGMAAVFGSIVQAWMPTVILPGAFKRTLRDNAKRVRILWQHNPTEPIGLPTSLAETNKGLEVEGKLSKTPRGLEAITLMRDGVLDEMSIGFDPVEGAIELLPLSRCLELNLLSDPTQYANLDKATMLRVLKELTLWEISLVTFAADPLAKVQAVHAQQQAIKVKPLRAHDYTLDRLANLRI